MHQLVVKKFSTLFDARCNHEVQYFYLRGGVAGVIYIEFRDYALNTCGTSMINS